MQIVEVDMADSDPFVAEGPWSNEPMDGPLLKDVVSSDTARLFSLCSCDEIVHVMRLYM